MSGDHLVVDFGLVAGLRARLDEIESVEPFRPDPLHPVPLGVDVDQGLSGRPCPAAPATATC